MKKAARHPKNVSARVWAGCLTHSSVQRGLMKRDCASHRQCGSMVSCWRCGCYPLSRGHRSMQCCTESLEQRHNHTQRWQQRHNHTNNVAHNAFPHWPLLLLDIWDYWLSTAGNVAIPCCKMPQENFQTYKIQRPEWHENASEENVSMFELKGG